MKHFKGIIATSQIDAHNEAISVDALNDLVERINSDYIPMGIEHDPRVPPKGRLVSARLVRLEDGEHGVEAIGEIFEAGDGTEMVSDGREIPLSKLEDGRLHIEFDRSYSDQEDQDIINEIGRLFSSKPREEIKKALDPLSILTIGGAFVLGAIATGFAKSMGSDAYDSLKAKTKKLLRKRKRDKGQEALLIFRFHVRTNDQDIEVEAILSNPSDEDIDAFFSSGMEQIDSWVSRHFDPSIGMRRITAEYANRELRLIFGVRKDAFPIIPKENRN